MKRWLAVSLLCMGLSSVTYGQEAIKLDKISAVPYQYQGKAYIRGEYQDLSAYSYKIFAEKGTTYLPLRMMAELLSSPAESWSVDWSPAAPEKVVLRCTYMEEVNNGSMSNGKEKVIQVSVGSTKAKVGKEEMTLSKAPKRFKGVTTLPIRSIGELVGKKVAYKNGLIILSSDPFDEKDKSQDQALLSIKQELESKNVSVENDDGQLITQAGGKCYYLVSHYDEKTEKYLDMLYEQVPGKKAKLLKEFNGEGSKAIGFYEQKFYYIEAGRLYMMDLATGKSTVMVDKAENRIQGYVDRLFYKDGSCYVVEHQGDGIMGCEYLYEIQAGKMKQLASAHAFSSIVINGNQIYYGEMTNSIGALDTEADAANLYCYDKTTGQVKNIGSKDYIYDISVETTEGGGCCVSTSGEAFAAGGKLYTLGFEKTGDHKAVLCAIDPADNSQMQVTGHTNTFKYVGGRVYYLDADTGYLKVVDLKTMQDKTLINKAVAKYEMKNGNIYYTLKSSRQQVYEGIYCYNTGTAKTTVITTGLVKEFKVGKSGTAYVGTGDESGIYKWSAGRRAAIEKGWVEQAVFGEDSIWYCIHGKQGGRIAIF